MDTLLPMMFLGLRKLGNICCGHKMFLNKIRNIFCVPDTKFVPATNVARTGKRGNICVGNNVSGTMCPRLPWPLVYTFSSRSLQTSTWKRQVLYLKVQFKSGFVPVSTDSKDLSIFYLPGFCAYRKKTT